jgi:uncharacterized repeat protein (TIGR01451 family)
MRYQILIERGSLRQVLISVCLFSLACVLSCRAARAQGIAVDSVSTGAGPNSQVSSLTWTHTVGAGANRILIVGLSLRDGNVAATGVTYGGQALTRVGFINSVGNQNRTEMWRLIAPPVGTASVAVTLNQSKQIVGGSISLTGVDQTTPLGTFVSATAQSTTASVAVASATGELVLDTMTANGDANSTGIAAGSGQAEQWNIFSGAGNASSARGGGSTKPGAASVTMSWTLGVSKPWSIGAVALKPVSAPNVVLTKSVSPSGTLPPGSDLNYTVAFSNTGNLAAVSFVMTDQIPASTDFKVGSESHNLGTTGLTVSVSYSNDGGATWTYTPSGGAGGAPAGYDRNVTHVRWSFAGSLSQTSPNNAGSVSFSVRIQ